MAFSDVQKVQEDTRRHLSESVPHSIDPVLHTEERGPQPGSFVCSCAGGCVFAVLAKPFLPVNTLAAVSTAVSVGEACASATKTCNSLCKVQSC